MISLIEPTYKSYLIISPVAPINRTCSRKKTKQDGNLENRKPKVYFKDILDKEILMGVGTKFSVRI